MDRVTCLPRLNILLRVVLKQIVMHYILNKSVLLIVVLESVPLILNPNELHAVSPKLYSKTIIFGNVLEICPDNSVSVFLFTLIKSLKQDRVNEFKKLKKLLAFVE